MGFGNVGEPSRHESSTRDSLQRPGSKELMEPFGLGKSDSRRGKRQQRGTERVAGTKTQRQSASEWGEQHLEDVLG